MFVAHLLTLDSMRQHKLQRVHKQNCPWNVFTVIIKEGGDFLATPLGD